MTQVVGIAAVIVLALAAVGGLRSLERSTPVDEPVPTLTPDLGVDPPPVDFPPRGEASRPITGKVVVSFHGEDVEGALWTGIDVYVYTDGRVIWGRCSERQSGNTDDYTGTFQGCAMADSDDGSPPLNTGWVQQLLSHEAVEALRAEVLATGVFESKWESVTPNSTDLLDWMSIRVRDGDRTREVAVAYQVLDFNPPTARELAGLEHLQEIFLDLETWFAPPAWVDETVNPFIPSSYTFWAKSAREDALLRDALSVDVVQLTPSDVPTPTDQLLTRPGCDSVTLGEARAIVQGFEAVGVARSEEMSGAGIAFLLRGGEDALAVYFEPVLPHELVTC